MKHLILTSLGAVALFTLTGCTTVVEKEPETVSTTTTEETTVRRPVTGVSTTTETVRY